LRVLISSLYPYLFLGLYLSIPFDNYFRALPNILLGVLIAAFLLIVKKSDFLKLKKAPTLVLFALLTSMAVIAAFNNQLEQDWSIISKLLLALALTVLYLPVRDMTKVNNAVIFSSLAAIVFSVVNIFILVNLSQDVALDFPRQVVEALLIDRLYLGMLAILSILISYQLISNKYHPNNRYHLANIVVNVLFVFLMLSKVAMIILLLLVILKQFYQRNWLSRALSALVGAAVLILLVVIPFSNPKDPEVRQTSESALERLLDNTFTWELRRTVWSCAVHVAQENPVGLTGLGVQATRTGLLSCYEQLDDRRQSREFVIARYNSHNQFMDTYLVFGLVGLILLLAFFVTAFFGSRRHFLPTAFLLVLGGYCLVENVFYRQIGGYYVGLMLIFILTHNEFSNNKQPEKHE
jgi:O-antigen ligase